MQNATEFLSTPPQRPKFGNYARDAQGKGDYRAVTQGGGRYEQDELNLQWRLLTWA